MANKDLKRGSHKITEDIWWYEEPKGIYLYIQNKDGGLSHEIIIPWIQIRSALARKDK